MTDTIRPWVEASFETFGTERSCFGTNWPVDKMYSDYRTRIAAYWDIVAQYGADEQAAFLAGNADRVYRI